MKRSLILTSAVAVALAVGGCASDSKKGETASTAKSEANKSDSKRPWWKLPKSLTKEPDFKPWTYGEVRQGKGLLSDDEDGFTVYNQPSRGSADPSKPEKVKR